MKLTTDHSLWPAGLPSEPQGTVKWSGGLINWSEPDYVSAGTLLLLFPTKKFTIGQATSTPSTNLSLWNATTPLPLALKLPHMSTVLTRRWTLLPSLSPMPQP